MMHSDLQAFVLTHENVAFTRAFAELERELTRQLCLSVQRSARARDQTWRKKSLFNQNDAKELAKLWRSGWWDQQTMADWFGINISTLRDTIHRAENRGRYQKVMTASAANTPVIVTNVDEGNVNEQHCK